MDEQAAMEGVVIGADLVDVAKQIEEETARAMGSLADGGTMMALEQLRNLVEMNQRHSGADVVLIEDDPPGVPAGADLVAIEDDLDGIPAGQPEPSVDDRDPVLTDGDASQEEPGLMEHGVVERSGLDELAAPSCRC